MNTKCLFLLLAFAASAQAGIDDRAMLGTFAVQCSDLSKGAVVITMSSATLIQGERTTVANSLEDQTPGYFGKGEPPKSFVGAADLNADGAFIGTVVVSKDARGLVLKTAGPGGKLLQAGPVFNAGQNAFRKCAVN